MSTAAPCYSGSCFCGSVRFHYSAAPFYRAFCHCSICRKICGSVTGVAWVGFPDSSIIIDSGKEFLNSFNATDRMTRFHCRVCSAPVFGQSLLEEAKFQDSPLSAFDRTADGEIVDFDSLQPDSHIFYESVGKKWKAAWDSDGLVKFDQLPGH